MDRRTFIALLGGGTATTWLGCRAPHASSAAHAGDYPVRPVPFTAVRIQDTFWAPRLTTNREITLSACFRKCEETGRLLHFDLASGAAHGAYEGRRYDDSDVFKVIEGASYALQIQPDPTLDGYLDNLIARIAAAQEADGYLYTTRTANPEQPVDTSPGRWSDLAHGHELYNVGHLYEAAVAHYQATGKRSLLDVAIRNADLIDQVFGPGRKIGVPGHEEIEIGLVKLYRATGERRYLDLARFFVTERGHAEHRELLGAYAQDHEPILQQTAAVGHAVRAGYLYSGVADVAALEDDADYVAAIDGIWQDVVSSKLYLTGGIGASRDGERFGEPFELPNAEAYAETCAAIANMLWNHRLFLLHGDAKYIDVFERTLYNGFLSGVSLSGDQFFYPNPLAADGQWTFNHGSAERQPWFGTACCPTNVVRFMPSIPGYVFAVRDHSVYVNLYIGGTGTVDVAGQALGLEISTAYPWDGSVALSVRPERETSFALRLRLPGWADGRPVPSDLYRYVNQATDPVSIEVNGERMEAPVEQGYAVIDRSWTAGDTVRLVLPMPVRRVVADARVQATSGRVAIERGPLVYCLEGIDNEGDVENVALGDSVPLQTVRREELGGYLAIEGSDDPAEATRRIVAVPYHLWAHRGPGSMAVWIRRAES